MMNQIFERDLSCSTLTKATKTTAIAEAESGTPKTTAPLRAALLTTLLAIQSVSAAPASIMIDLDLTTPGVQNSITGATEGQVVNFALVATNFTGNIHCINGIGGDISSRGSMSAAYDSTIRAGGIAAFTDESFISNITDSNNSFMGVDVIPTGNLTSHNLAPLSGYTDNVGGVGMRDLDSNLDIDNHVVSFRNVPGGSVPYVTIFVASMTITNVSGGSLEMFPSGVFDNPPVIPGPNGTVALFPGGQPFTFAQSGDFMLHTEGHDFDQCETGIGTIAGATITGVPAPSAIALLAFGAFGSLSRRSRN